MLMESCYAGSRKSLDPQPREESGKAEISRGRQLKHHEANIKMKTYASPTKPLPEGQWTAWHIELNCRIWDFTGT